MSWLTLLLLAHGSYPLAYQLVERPGQPTRLVAGTSFGLLVSDDDGATWQWVCEEAIGFGTNLYPVWWVSPSGAILGGSFKGLFRSEDHGCSWTTHPDFARLADGGSGTGVSDLHSNGTYLYAASGTYGVTNHVWRSTNDGVDWTPLSIASAGEFYTTIRSAPSRPQRLYVGAWWFRPSDTEALYVSDDNGDTFQRIDISASLPLVPITDAGMGLLRGSFYVYAVDPNDPDHLFAGVQQGDDPIHSFILDSPDRGMTWRKLLDSPDQVSSGAISEDGGTLYAATNVRLYVSAGAGPFAPLDVPTRNACIATFGPRVYACGWPEVDGFAVAREPIGVAPFEPLLTWPRVNGVVACDAASKVTTQCAGYFPALVASFPPPFDGGTAGGAGGGNGGTGGGSGGGGAAPPAGCHCSAGGAELSLTLWLLLARLGPALHAFRRRRVHR